MMQKETAEKSMQNGRALLNTCYTVTEPPEQLTASACNLWVLYTVECRALIIFYTVQ